MKLSFSLNKSKPDAAAPSLKRPAVFASVEDEEPIDAAPTSLSADHNIAANKKLIAYNVESSKAMRKRMADEKKVDETVYEYDEVWDKMQEAKLQQKEAREADSKERKVNRS
jgi:coiled-coil domain-containing protein 55